MNVYDIVIIGGGLAGLTAALHLSQNNFEVLVIEKQRYPNHKVCGEYLSNEIKPYLDTLGVELPNPVSIDTLQFSTREGNQFIAKLPLGGMGISRYALDKALYLTALTNGVEFVFEAVKNVNFANNRFTLTTTSGNKYNSEIVIGAYGKRSVLDKDLNRKFVGRKSPWLGIKMHYQLKDFPDDLVALHNFKGGYAGLSKTETGAINFCYLVNYKSFESYKDIDHFNKNVVSKNPFLAQFLQNATPIFNKPLSIAQVSFDQKTTIERHMLMCGDTAGLIHPLCGNGMAMAIHSAKIAAECIISYLSAVDRSREALESDYNSIWEATFKRRLAAGRKLQTVLMQPVLAKVLMKLAVKSPGIVKKVIKSTHGKPITI
ncbi:NAD(P)/FAD-dependent oxidoreductase [Muriicola sp. Z0-33]|uniref:NAD(P)/FAD-dependent oxidoreductase n=1 Tax=Muriicola sp. Z0-33 TaxID=2816957 RepID=UPI00223817C0|nr:NAD(P)/FAD-dependent oxidoreductase [Muriicola sp. Z0-33]MCW5515317.1 NAD(P)/FAD-dependent oxidoreductase [Muriicola sp. Z0-33]